MAARSSAACMPTMPAPITSTASLELLFDCDTCLLLTLVIRLSGPPGASGRPGASSGPSGRPAARKRCRAVRCNYRMGRAASSGSNPSWCKDFLLVQVEIALAKRAADDDRLCAAGPGPGEKLTDEGKSDVLSRNARSGPRSRWSYRTSPGRAPPVAATMRSRCRGFG